MTLASPQNKQLAPFDNIRGMLYKMKGQIERALPKHVTAERMTRLALTELRKTPKLLDCSQNLSVARLWLALN